MPFLKYRCTACGKVFEELVSAAGSPPRCPACGAETERFYKGKCSFGAPGSGSCSGNCAHCAGCGGH